MLKEVSAQLRHRLDAVANPRVHAANRSGGHTTIETNNRIVLTHPQWVPHWRRTRGRRSSVTNAIKT
jgi:hypothetical protein